MVQLPSSRLLPSSRRGRFQVLGARLGPPASLPVFLFAARTPLFPSRQAQGQEVLLTFWRRGRGPGRSPGRRGSRDLGLAGRRLSILRGWREPSVAVLRDPTLARGPPHCPRASRGLDPGPPRGPACAHLTCGAAGTMPVSGLGPRVLRRRPPDAGWTAGHVEP